MSDTWDAVDGYITDLFVGADPALDAALVAAEEAGMPSISVSPPQGKLLHLIARATGARRILEVGTLAGYSAIWLGRALPRDGRLITLEVSEPYAAVARSNLERAGLSGSVEVRVGDARRTMAGLASEEPFDMIFIDADKPSYPDYLEASLELARRGTVIVADNVVRDGAILEADGDDVVRGVRRFNEMLATDRRVSATVIQTVGSKGYDGLAVALVVV